MSVRTGLHADSVELATDPVPSIHIDNVSANPERGVHELVAAWVDRRPEACAVRESATGRELSYAQLWRLAGRLAGDLAAHGVRPGAIVPVDLDRSADLVVAMLGILRAGAAYLPLDSQTPADRLAAILAESDARVVVSSSMVDGDRLPLRHARVRVPARTATAEPEPPEVTAHGDDPAYVAYTSGSTGRPKGAVVPHRAVVRLVVEPTYCSLAPGDRVANAANPAFDATTFEVWAALTAGATVVVIPTATELSLDAWERLVRDERLNAMVLTTALFHMVARERPSAFRTLDTLIVGGEQMDLAVTRQVLSSDPPRRLVNGYGPTETTTFAASFDCTPDSLAGLDRVPIGTALQHTRLYVLDEDLRPVRPGEAGELCVGGPGVATGYLRRPELTAERFVPEPASGPVGGAVSGPVGGAPADAGMMYRTGDVVRQLPSGVLEMLGRRDRQVKLRGFRIELEEVERAALATGLVDSAFVEKVGDGPGAFLAGFVLGSRTSQPPAGDLPSELARALGTRLPAYMVPSRWVVLTELPIGPTGKVDRGDLLARLAGGDRPGEPGGDRGGDPLAAAAERIWCEVLGVDAAGPGDNFLEAGGNSILAMQLASRLRERLAVEIEPSDVLLADSLAVLVARIRDAGLTAR
jgi:amino acid adenylation domain-containing protein